MKNIWIILVLLGGFTSCDHKSVYQEPEPAIPDINKILPMEAKHIEVPEDSYALVRFYGDTLAVLTETADIMVPKSNAVTKAFDNAVTIEFLKKEGNNTVTFSYQVYQVLAFEDSEHADYDYNDLVIHVRVYQQGNKTKLYIHPIALGSIKPIAFGLVVSDKGNTVKDVVLVENCREELFGGLSGYINTDLTIDRQKYNSGDVKAFDLEVPSVSGKSLNWFIEVDEGKRLYAVSKDYSCLDDKGMAYGLVLSHIRDNHFSYKSSTECGYDWFNYPEEKKPIWEVYPDFSGYLKGTMDFRIFSKPLEGAYPAIVTKNDDGKNATDDCLYAILFN